MDGHQSYPLNFFFTEEINSLSFCLYQAGVENVLYNYC